jgi:hypothetical protein
MQRNVFVALDDRLLELARELQPLGFGELHGLLAQVVEKFCRGHRCSVLIASEVFQHPNCLW